MSIDTTREFAQLLDEHDDLAAYRSRFVIQDTDLIYMDGNSLGMLPVQTPELVEKIVKDVWGKNLIRSWGERWFEAPIQVG